VTDTCESDFGKRARAGIPRRSPTTARAIRAFSGIFLGSALTRMTTACRPWRDE